MKPPPTLPETNMAPENNPLEKESSFLSTFLFRAPTGFFKRLRLCPPTVVAVLKHLPKVWHMLSCFISDRNMGIDTWRIIPVSKWLNNQWLESPRSRLVPLPSGLFYGWNKWWLLTLLTNWEPILQVNGLFFWPCVLHSRVNIEWRRTENAALDCHRFPGSTLVYSYLPAPMKWYTGCWQIKFLESNIAIVHFYYINHLNLPLKKGGIFYVRPCCFPNPFPSSLTRLKVGTCRTYQFNELFCDVKRLDRP